VELTATVPNATISIKNLLFATDFSQASAAALPYAIAISRHYGSTLHATHVVTESAFVMSSGWADPSLIGAAYENTRSLAQAKMHDLDVRLEGLPHQTWVCTGEFWDSIAEVIALNHIDFLVSGTHGRTGMSKLLMGSTAEEILRRARCPVLTVGPRVLAQSEATRRTANGDIIPPEIRFQRIVYATDFTAQSLAAKPLAFSLAREFKADLIAIHVIEDGADLTRTPGPVERASHRLQELVSEEETLLRRPVLLVEFGSPADRILELAAEYRADLIVLGVRPPGSFGVATHIPWATVPKVVAGAHCPVLTVRG
jgi:nucleotide-binding universal stress UspA family protein